MTTMSQVKQVVQPLLERNPDLALVGRLVVVKPVHHILRGIYIDRCSNPLLFIPKYAVIFLFEPSDSLSFNWGQEVYRTSPGSGLFDISDPDTAMDMCEGIEQQALPRLRQVQSLDDFVTFTSKENFSYTYLDLYEIRKIYVDVARGDLNSARAICAFLATEHGRRKNLPMMHEEYNLIMDRLCPLLAANDKPGLARFLQECEAKSVRNLKLEKLWEATPFPLEALPDA